MTEKMKEYNDNIKSLTNQVGKLNDENLKLNSDIKVIRVEHSEMLHTIHTLESKNDKLVQENITLKDMIYGGKNKDNRGLEYVH